jgi:hypothetical protein
VIWKLVYESRPWALNAERAGGKRGVGGRYGQSILTKEWRKEYARLCLVQKVPALQHVDIEVRQICRDRRRCDVGAVFPAAKAAIDGIVDAGVIPDDTDDYVHETAFRPALITGTDALQLLVVGEPCSREEKIIRNQRRAIELMRKVGIQVGP